MPHENTIARMKTVTCWCKTKVSRGTSSTKSYTTTKLVWYLSVKHMEIHKQYPERTESNEATDKIPKKYEREHCSKYYSR